MTSIRRKRPTLIRGNPEVLTLNPIGQFESLVRAKKNTDFKSLSNLADRLAESCTDVVISRKDFQDSRVLFENDDIKGHVPVFFQGEKSNPMSDFSFGQLCSKLGVPNSYIQRCLSKNNVSPEFLTLAESNLEVWQKNYQGNEVLLRHYEDTIRGVLSNRYSMCDTHEILGVLSDVVDTEEYKVNEYFMSPERFHARVIQKEMLPIKGEDLFAGIQIDSSDVGRSTLIVTFLIYKQVCTNGLCLTKGNATLFKQKHLGITANMFKDNLYVAMGQIPSLCKWATKTITEKIADGARFDNLTPDEMNDLIKQVSTATSLDEAGSKGVIEVMYDKYTHNQWGLINAITEVAQNFTLERRIELEKIAADMLIA